MGLVSVPPRVGVFLARHGLAGAAARRVAVGDGEVWRVGPVADARGAPGWRTLRVWPSQGVDLDAIHTQVAWLDALAAEGLHVPAPLRDRAGAVLMDGAAEAQGLRAVLLHWVPGRILFAALRPVHLQRVGRLMARLHGSAERLAQTGRITSRRVQGIPIDAWARGQFAESVVCPPALRAAVVRACAGLQARMADRPRDSRHWGYLHGDLHPWNLVHHRGEVGAIDFGDSGWGWWAQDVAAVLQWMHDPLPGWHDHRPAYPALRDALFDGYASLRPLPPGSLDGLDDLLLLRRLGTLQWMIDDWPRADHRPWGPAFLASLRHTLVAQRRAGQAAARVVLPLRRSCAAARRG